MSRSRLSSVGQSKHSTPTNGGRRALGPYSKALRRGAIAGIDGRSIEGRFLADLTKQLTDHLGGRLSTPQRLLVSRIARVSLRIEMLDMKIAEGKATDLDIRTLGGLSSQFRLMLREIGMKAAPRAQMSLADALRTGSDHGD